MTTKPRTKTRTYLTNYRITAACLDGCDIEAITKVLDGSEFGHIRAIVRAARICPTVTPMAYYDSLEWALS